MLNISTLEPALAQEPEPKLAPDRSRTVPGTEPDQHGTQQELFSPAEVPGQIDPVRVEICLFLI